MRRTAVKSIAKAAAMIFTVALSQTMLAQWPKYSIPNVPKTADGQVNLDAPAARTADGKPDLGGVWDIIPCIDCPAAQGRGRGAAPAAGGGRGAGAPAADAGRGAAAPAADQARGANAAAG